MKQDLPKRRYTISREAYWQSMFNDFSRFETDHEISGWSAQGLGLRLAAYLAMLPSFKLGTDARVLDLGCGSGHYSRMLGRSGFRVTGLDFAWQVLRKAYKRTRLNSVHFLTGDAVHLPFGHNIFDHVVCIGLFQSLQDHRSALREMYRVLKPGGSACLMTLNKTCIKNRMDWVLRREEIIVVKGVRQPRLRTYDPETFRQAFEKTGFCRVIQQPVQIYPEALNRMKPLLHAWNCLPILNYLTARSFMISGYKSIQKSDNRQ